MDPRDPISQTLDGDHPHHMSPRWPRHDDIIVMRRRLGALAPKACFLSSHTLDIIPSLGTTRQRTLSPWWSHRNLLTSKFGHPLLCPCRHSLDGNRGRSSYGENHVFFLGLGMTHG